MRTRVLAIKYVIHALGQTLHALIAKFLPSFLFSLIMVVLIPVKMDTSLMRIIFNVFSAIMPARLAMDQDTTNATIVLMDTLNKMENVNHTVLED